MGKRALQVLGLGALAYIIYMYYKKKGEVQIVVAPPTETPRVRTKADIVKAQLKSEGAKVVEPYLESAEAKAAEKKFKASISANKELLMTGKSQYVTLENLIPNRYGMYNNFSGKYNRLNAEDTTNIDIAEMTQELYKRPKTFFNNALI